jgi:hypothetical protein
VSVRAALLLMMCDSLLFALNGKAFEKEKENDPENERLLGAGDAVRELLRLEVLLLVLLLFGVDERLRLELRKKDSDELRRNGRLPSLTRGSRSSSETLGMQEELEAAAVATDSVVTHCHSFSCSKNTGNVGRKLIVALSGI